MGRQKAIPQDGTGISGTGQAGEQSAWHLVVRGAPWGDKLITRPVLGQDGVMTLELDRQIGGCGFHVL